MLKSWEKCPCAHSRELGLYLWRRSGSRVADGISLDFLRSPDVYKSRLVWEALDCRWSYGRWASWRANTHNNGNTRIFRWEWHGWGSGPPVSNPQKKSPRSTAVSSVSSLSSRTRCLSVWKGKNAYAHSPEVTAWNPTPWTLHSLCFDAGVRSSRILKEILHHASRTPSLAIEGKLLPWFLQHMYDTGLVDMTKIFSVVEHMSFGPTLVRKLAIFLVLGACLSSRAHGAIDPSECGSLYQNPRCREDCGSCGRCKKKCIGFSAFAKRRWFAHLWVILSNLLTSVMQTQECRAVSSNGN